jgi:hypothetical protein
VTRTFTSSRSVKLTNDAVFTAPATENYIATLTDMTPASRSNLRSMLYRMSDVLLGTAGKGDMTNALSAASPSEPFIETHTFEMQDWEKAQSVARSDHACVLVISGFGAGRL